MPIEPEPRPPRASRLERALDAAVAGFPMWDGPLYAAFAFGCVLYVATLFYGYMQIQTHGTWSAPLDDVFIHFDYARATARGYPFQWSEGNGYSSGNTSLLYPFVLALGYLVGFRGLAIMVFAALVACVSTFGFLLASGKMLDPLGRWAKYLVPPAVVSLGALDWTLFSGMENAFHLGLWGLCLVLVLWLERAAREGRPVARIAWIAGGASVLLFLTRPESVVCIASFAVFAAWCVLRGDVPAGTTDERSRRRRKALATMLRVGVPGAVALVAQAVANRVLTGEISANGAIAKLTINNPYMPAAEKWATYKFLLGYVVVRNTQHHFADATPYGWLVPVLAVAPLASPKVRRYAVLLWVQLVGWLALVAMNGQVRWQNERYTMAAVAWLFVLAAMGLTTIASEAGRTRKQRVGWALRASAAVGLAALYWVHQAPNVRDQIWFFGRASRNILDQHVVAGGILARIGPKRVLVGDAGALMYASDRPGLDLIGLGGYHDLPFARAGVHGLGASLELIERLPRDERPDVMAIYPSWWGDLPGIFGRRLTGVVVTGNVICGGQEKVLYRADWSALDGSGRPASLVRGERIVDELDVADLVNERAHGYVFPHPGMGFATFRVLPDRAGRDLFDGGRDIPQGQVETARVQAPRGQGKLVVRAVAGPRPVSIEVSADDRVLGHLEVPRGEGWVEPTLTLPSDLPDGFELRLRPVNAGWTSFHAWIVETTSALSANGGEVDTVARPSSP
jgi:hypothetical protein